MHTPSSGSVNNKLVRPGIYEIQSGATSLFLNSVEEPVYNGWCDDALTLNSHPSRRGKWEIARVGGGYTIKQVASSLYCALADGEQFVYQPVVLSSVPTIWAIEYIDDLSEKVRIMWSVSDISWETVRTNEEPMLAIGKLFNGDGKQKDTLTWMLKPVGEPNVAGKLKPGLYTLQNKTSKTFVMMGPDERTLGCWPKDHFKNNDTRLWEISALGEGYTIRLHGTDKYCTLEDGISGSCSINLSTFPAAWKIVPNESPLHANEGYFQIYWGNTKMTWDLSGYGKAAANTPIHLQMQKATYQECRLFKFIP